MSTAHTTTSRIRQMLPFVGAALLICYFLWSTDIDALGEALAMADMTLFVAAMAVTTGVVWIYDTYCLTWFVRQTLGHRGRPEGASLRELAPVKAASYVLNILNYHAATVGMAWLIGRRKRVSFIEATGALAVMSWVDLVAVAAMAVAGIWLDPDLFSDRQALQGGLQAIAGVVFTVALLSVFLLQSGWRLGILQRLRQVPLLRPISSLTPLAMLQGLLLRIVLVLAYTLSGAVVMLAFDMQPQWGRLFVAMPILIVVGTVPISVNGIGTTQVLMRSLYAPFVVGGRAPGPVIDAYSSAMIIGFIVCRLVIAAPFLRSVLSELQQRATEQPQSESTTEA